MTYKELYIFVEGEDDERFVERILKPILEKKYDYVVIVKYAKEEYEWRNNFIKSIKSIGADYIYVTDINNSPCITGKKNIIKQKCRDIDIDKIIIVIKEIEGWYIAGIGQKIAKKLKIKLTHNVDANEITKEQFNSLIPRQFKDSRTNFMIEILKHYDIKLARKRNKSFDYFIRKFIEGK